ncbi:hypothetical protein FRACYDRAFT_240895 [Fragilariopsis cylindrus CCMP1102]|uniref:Uncharacterized protein n=1 Tax=Fragilariopsis cylindrus CCMP1102 TaxID=635003 RepID=A0A1E7F8L2_9STRA|nr:hypothetical protein FRACYDRAFT_240895 [Fragilariopsis cylindrus CCMP1102]|eukprot:OEU14355.1 hypothetical protein FRACYDRAFT_240895 [Fragilariopsis cylindrus CCMP1102]
MGEFGGDQWIMHDAKYCAILLKGGDRELWWNKSRASTTREASGGNPHGNPIGRTKTTTTTASAKPKPKKSPSTIPISCTRTTAAGESRIQRDARKGNINPSTIHNGNYGGLEPRKKDEYLGAQITAEEGQ